MWIFHVDLNGIFLIKVHQKFDRIFKMESGLFVVEFKFLSVFITLHIFHSIGLSHFIEYTFQ